MAIAKFGWLVSYPKSGNTWLRMMLISLMSGGKPVDINHSNNFDLNVNVCSHGELDEMFGIESSELTAFEIAALRPALHKAIAAHYDQGLILRKVHDRFWHTASGLAAFPAELTRGAVYLVRDPRDVVVSYAHHRGLGLDDIIDFMADADAILAVSTDRFKEQLPQPLGSWSSHAASWLGQHELPVLVIRYEDLLANTEARLSDIAIHLGLDVGPQDIEAAVNATRFDVLQTQEITRGFKERRIESSAPFFRQGKAGVWRDYLSAAQVARIETDHGAMMERFAYF